MITKLIIPGLDILKKYKHEIVKEDGLKRIIQISGVIPHFDRQRLYSEGWKTDLEGNNRYIFDLLLCK